MPRKPAARYGDKFEAIDFSVGKYHARKLPRVQYCQADYLEYLSTLNVLDGDEDLD